MKSTIKLDAGRALVIEQEPGGAQFTFTLFGAPMGSAKMDAQQCHAVVMAMVQDSKKLAIVQLMDWARAWVQNETCLPETPDELMTEVQRDALDALKSWGLL